MRSVRIGRVLMRRAVLARSFSVEETARLQQKIQQEQARKDKESKDQQEKDKKAMQAGARKQPEQMPAQTLEKPGKEHELELEAQFLAPNYEGSNKLKGKTALITGGDSGIGRSVAVLFAREGADVSIVYLNEHEDAKTTQHYVEREGRKCVLLSGDVQDKKFCQRAVEDTVKQLGQLDVLVNNAAFQEHAASIEDITEERLDLTFRTNIFGYFYMAQAALPHLKNGSSIINTGSVTGFRGSDQTIDYASTKGAIHSFTKSLASNLLSRGIRVNAVAPGPVWTPLLPSDRQKDGVKKFGKNTDIGRAAQAEEISPAYVFLAAPVCSSYITGLILPITGVVGAI